jgi:hypothetical protein
LTNSTSTQTPVFVPPAAAATSTTAVYNGVQKQDCQNCPPTKTVTVTCVETTTESCIVSTTTCTVQ